MKLSFSKQGVALFLSIFSIMLQPAALSWENRGVYWKGGNWCSPENNYCSLGNSYNGGWNQQNDYYQRLESIEYNGRIIRTGIRPNSDICYLVERILNQDHCDGYIGFNESTRTHIFRNYSHQQYYQNNQLNKSYPSNYWRHPAPTWNRGVCIYDDGRVRILCK